MDAFYEDIPITPSISGVDGSSFSIDILTGVTVLQEYLLARYSTKLLLFLSWLFPHGSFPRHGTFLLWLIPLRVGVSDFG